MFLLLSETGKYQHNNGYYIRKCLKYFLHTSSQSRDIQIQNIQRTEEKCSPDSVQRFPQCKDYQCHCQPAAVTESVVCLGSAGVFHYEIKSPKSCKSCTDTGRQIFIFRNVDTCCICCTRILTDGTETQTSSCLKQEIG